MYSVGFILEIARRGGRDPQSLAGSSGESVIVCPYSERHTNGDFHPSCRLNPHKNSWYCDPCGEGGGVKELALALGVAADELRVSKNARGASTDRLKGGKRPLVFVASGPISVDTMTPLATRCGKKYSAETWLAFGVLEGVVHPEGLPQRQTPAIAFPLPDGGVHAYRYERADKRSRWCFANGGKPGLIPVGFEREGVVLICEGQWDGMLAYELGFPVAAVTGAGALNPEWVGLFQGRQAGIVLDVDGAGRNGAFKLEKLLKAAAIAAVDVRLPLSGNTEKDGKDFSDYVSAYGADALRRFIAEAMDRGLKTSRTCVAVLVPGALEILSDMAAAFPTLCGALHMALATAGYLALSGNDQPLAVFLMGPPSSGKTLVIRLLLPGDIQALEAYVHRCDDFTKASFVSRAANVPAEKLAEIDLLPKLEDRLLVTKELAPIFRGKEDDLTQLFAVLTSVLDGDGYVTAGGSVGTRGYDRKIFFCWLGGTTPFPNQTWRVMSALGPRILFYATDSVEPTLEDLITAQQEGQSSIEVELHRKVGNFLIQFFKANPPRSVAESAITCDEAGRRFIALCARLTARLRAGLSIREPQDRSEGESRYGPPEKEHEYRLVRTLNRLAKGSALILGRDTVGGDDLNLVQHIALSSGPENRRKVAGALIALTREALVRGDDDEVEVSVRAIADRIECSLPTARHYAEELHVLKIAFYRPGLKGDPDGGRLVLTPEFRELAR